MCNQKVMDSQLSLLENGKTNDIQKTGSKQKLATLLSMKKLTNPTDSDRELLT